MNKIMKRAMRNWIMCPLFIWVLRFGSIYFAMPTATAFVQVTAPVISSTRTTSTLPYSSRSTTGTTILWIPTPTVGYSRAKPKSTTISNPSKMSSKIFLSNMDMTDIDSARKLFYLWFFGGSGGAGIAIAAFPDMYRRFMEMRSLAMKGPTEGGETIGISPLCLYPDDLKLKDVKKVLNNPMSVETMVKLGPKESFWAQRGYLRYEAFEAANRNCNPLAVRAIFDAMTTSTSTVEPDLAQDLLDSFREDLTVLKNALLVNKMKGYCAIAVLLFLLGLAATVSLEAFAAGWFPNWPGRDDFPIGLVSPGFWTIPDYWI